VDGVTGVRTFHDVARVEPTAPFTSHEVRREEEAGVSTFHDVDRVDAVADRTCHEVALLAVTLTTPSRM
jgi:hypothetical protein